MDYSTGKLGFIFVVGLLLSCLGAGVVARRYRTTMRHLMSAPVAARGAPMPAPTPPRAADAPAPRVAAVSLAANRRDAARLGLLLVGLSCLMAVSSAWIWHALAFRGEPLLWKRVAVSALLDLWPVVPVLALTWRWSLRRTLLALVVWAAFCYAVMLWRSIELRPMESALALAVLVGPPLLLVVLLCSGDATRAIAPWLLPPFVGLVWASTLGVDMLDVLVQGRSPIVGWLVTWLPVGLAIPLFALLPWAVAWWPLRRLGRAIGRAYARKQLSEGLMLFTAVWLIAQLAQALSVASEVGWKGVAMLLPLAWVPLGAAASRAVQRRADASPPTLLVLRVFQRDAQVQALFDHVVERWRVSGNTVLIAGTDLADRTLDADDVFTFLDGGLAARFVQTPADVAPRLAAFDLARDADGRFRVNECYCHDTTWQQALAALVQRSDVVLMDLRGFQAHNAGCCHELGVLARAPRLVRVVVLTDAQTDRSVAQRLTAAAPRGRFVWVASGAGPAARRRDVLAALCGEGPA